MADTLNVHAALIRDFDGNPNEFIRFVNIPPEISEDIAAQYNETTIIGRSAPILGYSTTGARVVSLELTFFAEDDTNSPQRVFRDIRFLQSFALPTYQGKSMQPPHRIQLVIGNFINIIGIVEAVPVTWGAPYRLGISGSATVQGATRDDNRRLAPSFPMLAKVTLTVKETLTIPPDLFQVRQSGQDGVGVFATVPEQIAGGSVASNLVNKGLTVF